MIENFGKKMAIILLILLMVLNLSYSAISTDINPIDDEEPRLNLFGTIKDDWYISCVTVAFTASPRVPVNYYEYRLDQSDWTVFTPGLTICENGGHLFEWRWIDTDQRVHYTSNPSQILKIDNAPPSISLNKEDSTFGNTVTFTAEVSDIPGSGIDYVEFYLNDVLVGNISTGPFEYVWDGLQDTNDQVYAIAYDKLGFSAQSEILESRSISNNILLKFFNWVSQLFSYFFFYN